MLGTVESLMVKVEECLSSQSTLADVRRYWKEYGVGAAPLLDEGSTVAALVTQESVLQIPEDKIDFGAPAIEYAEINPERVTVDALLKEVWPLSGNWAVVESREGVFLGLISARILDYAWAAAADCRLKETDAVINCAHNGIVAINARGRITLFNPAAEVITRISSRQAIGENVMDVLQSELLDVVKTGEPQFRVTSNVGKRKYIANRTPIIQEGKVTGAVAVFLDVSEIELISEELTTVKNLNSELMTILDSSYDGILVCDGGGKVLRYNQAFLRVMGFTSEELLGRQVQEFFEDNMFAEVIRKRKANTFIEKRKKDNNGLLFTCTPVMDEDRVERVVINVRDITELTHLKEELERANELSQRYHQELAELRVQLKETNELVVNSAQMTRVLELVLRVAKVDSTVLITGESGVGKEVIACAIHNNSSRSNRPFIKINCGSIPETILESELFGYEAGAFTDANRQGKLGLFELADKGTLLLDEIGDMPFNLQVKLLRVLQEKEFIRLGGTRTRKVDVRIIAATNANLLQKVKENSFRSDLYFRLNVVPIHIPPLRERPSDIVPLVQELQKKFEQQYGIKKELSVEVFDRIYKYQWPGNVRELENILEFLYVTVGSPVIRLEDLPFQLRDQDVKDRESAVVVKSIIPLKKAVFELEKELIQLVMKQCGSTSKAATMLQVDQSTIVRKMQKFKKGL